MREITIQVPASTSNLGPGYDCLGVALQLDNSLTLSRAPAPMDAEANEEPAHPMVRESADAFYTESGVARFPFRWRIAGEVPMSRGLGSSVTLRLGVLHGLNALAGRPLDRQRIFELCAALEGHPDNAAPAQFGGFTVAGDAGVLRFAVGAELRFVLLIPGFEIRTADARRLLPEHVDRMAAVSSCGRACRITAAFAARRYEALRGAFVDGAFHQPHRLPLIPFLADVISAAEAAGALGGFLSGSGSTIACLTLHDAGKVGAAMKEASGLADAKIVVTGADNRGARRV